MTTLPGFHLEPGRFALGCALVGLLAYCDNAGSGPALVGAGEAADGAQSASAATGSDARVPSSGCTGSCPDGRAGTAAQPSGARAASSGGDASSPSDPRSTAGTRDRAVDPTQPGGPSQDASASADANSAPAADGGSTAGTLPAGVALCYGAGSESHPAVLHAMEVFGGRDVSARPGLIDELKAAAASLPNEERFAILHALMNLWRVQERDDLSDALAALEATRTTVSEMQRAYASCPTDHRIPGWLAPAQLMLGKLLGDDAQYAEGERVLEEGMRRYPAFVAFGKIRYYATLPPEDPEFPKAVEAVTEMLDACLTEEAKSDSTCVNGPIAPHNIEGTMLFLGDLYAKAQQRDKALEMYEWAKTFPDSGWETWLYRDVLEARIREVDTRMTGAQTPEILDDLPYIWDSNTGCSVCHQK